MRHGNNMNTVAVRIGRLLTGADHLPTLQEMGVPLEILEVAEGIVDGSDVPGIERSRLEFLIRFLIACDRGLVSNEARWPL
jgi:hypothetical protein